MSRPTVIGGMVVAWGDDAPSSPSPPVRNLEDELVPAVDLEARFRDPFGHLQKERNRAHIKAWTDRQKRIPTANPCPHCNRNMRRGLVTCGRRRCRTLQEAAQ